LGKYQFISLAGGVTLILVLYFGFEYKPDKIRNLEKSRSNNLEVTGIENLLLEARETLSLEEMKILEDMRADMNEAKDSIKLNAIKAYASKWYELGYPIISAYYAEEVAKADKSADSWSIAGTSYIIGMKTSEIEKERSFAFNRAIAAFENATSLESDNVNHQINLALVYVEKPLPTEPMKGILMLRDLNTKYPQNVAVIVQLARLAISTGQWERAEQRLKEALELDGQNRQANCLMVEVLTQKGESTLAQPFAVKCNEE
jgi:predicted Zn-dependent protease